jgi:hypothetical protein
MKKLPRPAPLAEEAAHREHITPEFEAGTEPRAYRRTTVIVEREILSFFTGRAVAESVVTPVAQPADGEIAPAPPDQNLPQASASTPVLFKDKTLL